MASPLPYSVAAETVPSDEGDDIARIGQVMRELLQLRKKNTGRYRRDVHVKSHGSARGELRVLDCLPSELAQGLFKQPGTYSAAVRFSNSAPWVQPDAVPDGRGLAIQVENVAGERCASQLPELATQDFVMVNNPTFIARDVKEYLMLEEARLRAGDRPARLPLEVVKRAWHGFRWRCGGVLAAARIAGQMPSHPARYTYFSMVPIRYGQYIAKYRVRPSATNRELSAWPSLSLAVKRDPMRHWLAETLAHHSLSFDLQIQLRTSETSMPIEDATVEWPERESPYCTVAELTLPPQIISRREDAPSGERRSFSVWNAIADHQPLGGINRVRRFAYAISATARQTQSL